MLLTLFLIAAPVILALYIVTRKPVPTRTTPPVTCVIVLGSGGHTAEMLKLVLSLDPKKYAPRHYVIANTDTFSGDKLRDMETSLAGKNTEWTVENISRCRQVGETGVLKIGYAFTLAFIHSIRLILRLRPRVIITNGPGTCVPMLLAGFLLKVTYPARLVYVESICRVETLSLSGNIVRWIVDDFIVQWPQLAHKYKYTKYLGNRLI